MCSVSVPLLRHGPCLWLGCSTQQGEGQSLVYTGALSQRSLECSTFHSKGVISGIQPAAFSSSSLPHE